MEVNDIIEKFFSFVSKDKKFLFYQDFEILGQFLSRCNFEENVLNEIYKTMNYFVMHCLKFNLKKKKNEVLTKNTLKEIKTDSKLNTITTFNTYKIVSKKTNEFNPTKSVEFQKLYLNITKLKQLDMKISYELYRKYFLKAPKKCIDNMFLVIHKAQEILIHYNESKKCFSMQKRNSKRLVKKQSEKFDIDKPSYSRETIDNKNIDRKSNDHSGDFKITSVSDNEIILKNKEKFLNVLRDMTEQMNKRVTQISSKKSPHLANPSQDLFDNVHYYSNIDPIKIKTEDNLIQSFQEKPKEDGQKNIFEICEKNDNIEKRESVVNKDSIKINIEEKEKKQDTTIKTNVITYQRNQDKKEGKNQCACHCLII